MLTPSEIERFSMAFDEPMHKLEAAVMEDVVRRIKINGEITRAADWQLNRLYELGMSKAELQRLLKEHLNLEDKEIKALYERVLEQGYAHDSDLYRAVGVDRIPLKENKALQQLLAAVAAQTQEEFKNISGSLGFAVRQADGTLKFMPIADYYQKVLDEAVTGIASGAFDYNTAIKKAVSELTRSGLRTVDYASGWSNRVDVAARRAVVTGISQLTARVNEENAKLLDTDTFEVSWHSGARPSHQVWQGRWFTRKELEAVCGLGDVRGLCGANCRHSYYPVIPGISEPTYTPKQLEEMNAKENVPMKDITGKTYTKYEATQRQRRLETAMRADRQKIHLLEKAGANEDDIINARCHYRGLSQEYTRFSEAMGLRQQRQRITVDGLGNVGVGKTKIDLTAKDYNDILYMRGKMSNRDVRKWYIAHNDNIPNLIDLTKSIEEQAKQACMLRNKFKFEARKLMADQEARKELDKSDPTKTFEQLIEHKMKDKGMTYDEAVRDIVKTSTKTRRSVNLSLGLE